MQCARGETLYQIDVTTVIEHLDVYALAALHAAPVFLVYILLKVEVLDVAGRAAVGLVQAGWKAGGTRSGHVAIHRQFMVITYFINLMAGAERCACFLPGRHHIDMTAPTPGVHQER